MSPAVREFHGQRLRRMLADLQIEPSSLIAVGEGVIVDDLSRRVLTPGLRNRTLAEGLVSAVKLAAAAYPEVVP